MTLSERSAWASFWSGVGLGAVALAASLIVIARGVAGAPSFAVPLALVAAFAGAACLARVVPPPRAWPTLLALGVAGGLELAASQHSCTSGLIAIGALSIVAVLGVRVLGSRRGGASGRAAAGLALVSALIGEAMASASRARSTSQWFDPCLSDDGPIALAAHVVAVGLAIGAAWRWKAARAACVALAAAFGFGVTQRALEVLAVRATWPDGVVLGPVADAEVSIERLALLADIADAALAAIVVGALATALVRTLGARGRRGRAMIAALAVPLAASLALAAPSNDAPASLRFDARLRYEALSADELDRVRDLGRWSALRIVRPSDAAMYTSGPGTRESEILAADGAIPLSAPSLGEERDELVVHAVSPTVRERAPRAVRRLPTLNGSHTERLVTVRLGDVLDRVRLLCPGASREDCIRVKNPLLADLFPGPTTYLPAMEFAQLPASPRVGVVQSSIVLGGGAGIALAWIVATFLGLRGWRTRLAGAVPSHEAERHAPIVPGWLSPSVADAHHARSNAGRSYRSSARHHATFRTALRSSDALRGIANDLRRASTGAWPALVFAAAAVIAAVL